MLQEIAGKLQLAHVGSKEGLVAVEHMFDGRPIPVNYDLVPNVFTHYPEIASIGKILKKPKLKTLKRVLIKYHLKQLGKR